MERLQKRTALEYASSIGVPVVANLKGHYIREKLLQLLEHGNIPNIYIQRNQQLNDPRLLQCIVDLLATSAKPTKMVEQITVEHGGIYFSWPKRDELKLKEKKPNVGYTYNEASASPETWPWRYLTEYELINRGCRFQVLIHCYDESEFDKFVRKFIYRRLD